MTKSELQEAIADMDDGDIVTVKLGTVGSHYYGVASVTETTIHPPVGQPYQAVQILTAESGGGM